MVEFAKMQVETAKKEIADKVIVRYNTVCEDGTIKGVFNTQQEALDLANKLNGKSKLYHDWNISYICPGKEAILSTYPLENIK